MTRRDINVYLWDIKHACEAIRRFTSVKTRGDYDDDDLLQSAVERELMILGEALNKAVVVDPLSSRSISDTFQIINLRHPLVHDYRRTKREIIWNAVTTRVPALSREVTTRLPEEPPPEYFEQNNVVLRSSGRLSVFT